MAIAVPYPGNTVITVIGGLITSTLLTLVLVPVVYTYVDDAQRVLLRALRRPVRVTERG